MFRGFSTSSQVKTGALPRLSKASTVVLNMAEIIPRFINNYYSRLQNVRTFLQFPSTLALWLLLGMTALFLSPSLSNDAY